MRQLFLALMLGLLGVLVGVPCARAGCAVWDNLTAARKQAEDAAKALNNVVVPPDMELMITTSIAEKMHDNPGMSIEAALTEAHRELSFGDKAQLAPWLAARKLRDAADRAYSKAERAYIDEMNKKDPALAKAEKPFEAEQQWLETEKQVLKNMPLDDAHLDRVSEITKRLRAAYGKMKQDLGGFYDCHPDVRTFLDDKDERFEKIDALDAEIERRPGKKPGDPADSGNDDKAGTGDAKDGPQQPLPGEPEPPGPLGDVWVCDRPEVSGLKGKLTSVDATGFTYEREVNGQKVQARVKISKPQPLRLRNNQRVEIVMSAFGESSAPVDASWAPNNVISGQIPSDNGCSNIPKFNGPDDSSTATVRF